MIQSAIQTLGPWNWWILALILMGLEIAAPGTFFLWFGISAFVIGTISLAVGPDSTFWVWQTQLVGFVVLSVVAVLFGRRFMLRYAAGDEHETNINERGRQLIGRTVHLQQPISDGHGRVRIGDTTWRVTGPDLPQGAHVRVVEAEGSTLRVEALPQPDGDDTGGAGVV
jgi:inner membrane protein